MRAVDVMSRAAAQAGLPAGVGEARAMPGSGGGVEAASARDSTLRRVGFVLLVLSLVIVFVLDVRLPEVVLLPFLAAPVVAAATFLRPRATAVIGVVAVALGM